MKFLIIGGDAAGMSAASRAKRKQPDMDVIVLEKTQDVSYSACGMPYNIADPDRDMDLLVVRRAETFIEKNKINLLTGHTAEAIDPTKKIVTGTTMEGDAFSFVYDKLLIATGARPLLPDIPGIRLPGVLALKSLEHGKRIKSFIAENKVTKAVIIGMGYIGLEMSEALRERGIDVAMVKPGPTLLPWMTPDLAGMIRQELDNHGVAVHAGHGVIAIKKTESGLQVVCEDLSLDCQMVIAAMGVKPCSDMAVEAGLSTHESGAIAVDDRLRTSNPDIYAAGDCGDAINVITKKPCWIPLALRANRAGWAVADNVCNTPTSLPGIVGTAVFKLFNLEVARTGLTKAEAMAHGFSPEEVVVKTRSRAHGHKGSTTIYLSMVGDTETNRLLGVQMVGNEGVAHRINAAATALHAAMTVEAFAQTDLAYAPPFGPVWDPLLTTANQLIKKL